MLILPALKTVNVLNFKCYAFINIVFNSTNLYGVGGGGGVGELLLLPLLLNINF